jgi:hypothetical protein
VLLAEVSELYRFHIHRQVDEKWLGMGYVIYTTFRTRRKLKIKNRITLYINVQFLRHVEQGVSPLLYGLLCSSCPVCELFCSRSLKMYFYYISYIFVPEKIYIFRPFYLQNFYCVIKTSLLFFASNSTYLITSLCSFLLPTCMLYMEHCSKLSHWVSECIYSIRVQFGLRVQLLGT